MSFFKRLQWCAVFVLCPWVPGYAAEKVNVLVSEVASNGLDGAVGSVDLSPVFFLALITASLVATIGYISSRIGKLSNLIAVLQSQANTPSHHGPHEADDERLTAITENAFEAICIAHEGRIVTGNQALADLLDAPLSELMGREMMDFVAPESKEVVNHNMRANGKAATSIMLMSADGVKIPAEVRGRSIHFKNARMRIISVRDLREQVESEKRIRHMAMHDSLTGLPNRALYQEQLDERLKTVVSNTNQMALMLLDLDRFKDINDVHGHPAGDEVIRQAAQRLSRLIGEKDLVARLGGDEFAVIAMIDTEEAANVLAASIVHAMEKPFILPSGDTGTCGASVGVAIAPRDGTNPSELMSRADTALYKVKKKGRNGYCQFEPGMDAAEKKRVMLKEDLGKALENNRLELYVQPQADLRSHSIYGFECLLRWRDPVRGLVSPADFIPVAEESQLIIPVGRWVLEQAVGFAKDSEEALSFSVNVSPKQFKDANFAVFLEDLISKANLEPQRIELEVTETSLIEDDERAVRVIEQLKEIGVQMSLDDFGTGYSSMSYLSKFPFDRLKIDRSFMSGAIYSAKRRAIVKAMIEVGKALNMRVIAEGVETRDELDFLKSEGCDEAQGFLFGKPCPMKEAMQNLQLPIAATHRLRSQEEIDRLVEQLRATQALAG